MTLKVKLIIVGVALGVVFSFVAHRYLGCTAQVLQHLIACAVFPAESFTTVAALLFSSLWSS